MWVAATGNPSIDRIIKVWSLGFGRPPKLNVKLPLTRMIESGMTQFDKSLI